MIISYQKYSNTTISTWRWGDDHAKYQKSKKILTMKWQLHVPPTRLSLALFLLKFEFSYFFNWYKKKISQNKSLPMMIYITSLSKREVYSARPYLPIHMSVFDFVFTSCLLFRAFVLQLLIKATCYFWQNLYIGMHYLWIWF